MIRRPPGSTRTDTLPTRRSSDLAAAERERDVGDLLVALQLVGRGAGDVEDLAAQRQHRLGLARARLLGRAAGRIALHQEDLVCRLLLVTKNLSDITYSSTHLLEFIRLSPLYRLDRHSTTITTST